MSNAHVENETGPEGAVALLVVFLLVVVFIAQSGLLSGPSSKGDMLKPKAVEMQRSGEAPQFAGT